MTNPSNIFFTIIVAVFNGSKTIQQCIESVSQQTYLNKQLIIIDGGSTDGTVALLKAKEQVISYWISEPDKGIYNAWNKGLLKAEGEWVCFLGADDYFWNTQVLEQMSQQLEMMPAEVNVAYGQVMLLGANDEELYLSGEPWHKIKQKFKQKMSLPHQGVMHRKSLFKKQGYFDESFRITGDYELLLRELKTADAIFIPDLIIAGMRQGGISSYTENSLLVLYEFRRSQQKHKLGLPSVRWLLAIGRVYIRMVLWRLLGEKYTRKALDFGRRLMGLPPHWTLTE